ncbi:3-oxoacyl-ACP reductase FabG [Undibacterium cyanobacteriorum]|uniref:3-oxoacyl-ACP reductase FabG n=1 Tax=Undibacterium cyanobacteriorum TaxID=3073561 RepID=A0ABY9RLH5_9BURK|nr:3-oxoacyl-ACP reductase FabG [Undibacterium sp. 20NA77.5]WMW81549.1 3-oxoacyl-ACP reductase FabG [Undibacterium sp. 20NA77.5]
MKSPDKKPWVMITGGTRGIGKGLVEAFCAAQYEVVFTYQSSTASAEALEKSLQEKGYIAKAYCCDGADQAAMQALAKALIDERGAPYALVNNMGITRDTVLMRMSGEQWSEVINTNLNSVFYATRSFIDSMLSEGDGVVLQMSSVSGFKGNIGQSNYAASKAAMIGMTRALALELGRFNIRVNAIAPGYIATEMVSEIPEKKLKTIVDTIPLRRMGTVEEVASLATFLACPKNAYITGQTFVIDGGLTA